MKRFLFFFGLVVEEVQRLSLTLECILFSIVKFETVANSFYYDIVLFERRFITAQSSLNLKNLLFSCSFNTSLIFARLLFFFLPCFVDNTVTK